MTGKKSDIPPETRAALSLIGKIGAHTSWANTKDRTARTAPARAALDAKFLAEADGDPVRAEHLRKAHFARLAKKSAEVRQRNAADRRAKKADLAAKLLAEHRAESGGGA